MTPGRLRLIVMHVSTRCDQACAHCSIWRGPGALTAEWGVDERLATIRQARELGAGSILFTGGEPLLCDHIERLARTARSLGLSVQIATNGLGLSRAAAWIGDAVHELYVSLEGPEAVHDEVRGARMFARLRSSLAGILDLKVRPRLIARAVISTASASWAEETVAAAQDLGFDAISFLPMDATSKAFGGNPSEREAMSPDAHGLAAFRLAVSRLGALGQLGAFVLEDESKLRLMADRLEPLNRDREAPPCNAPEWSSVVEADGAIRPCFFQEAIGGAERGLRAVRASSDYAIVLRKLGRGNRTCAACVCPKYAPSTLGILRGGVRRALGRALPKLVNRTGNAA